MTSGRVIETTILEKSVWINVKSDDSVMGILVEKTDKARCVSEGDAIWWQSGLVYWTPRYNIEKRDGRVTLTHDIILNRIGTGCAERPVLTPAMTQ